MKEKIEYKILHKLVNHKYSDFDTEEKRFKECRSDLKKEIKSDEEIGLADHLKVINNTITLNPSKPLSNKTYQKYIEDFFNTPEIFSKCKCEKHINKYLQDTQEEYLETKASTDDTTEEDVSKEMFYGFGLVKMMPYKISIDNYIHFLDNHNRAKKVAKSDPKSAEIFLRTAMYLSKGLFIEAHNYQAFSIWHGQELDRNIYKDYYKQKNILHKNNALGIDEVITDLFQIYQGIIGKKINNVIRLISKYNDWHFKHRNSLIGDFNIPNFHLMPNLTQNQIDLILELNRLLLEESRYTNIYLGDTII